ncbi:MAG TPA: hypothetical protein VK251_07080, partial [Steroidobacteraceae bacterium]|nr:hypothetical protein [Steroidobacteraceae bacterium]
GSLPTASLLRPLGAPTITSFHSRALDRMLVAVLKCKPQAAGAQSRDHAEVNAVSFADDRYFDRS